MHKLPLFVDKYTCRSDTHLNLTFFRFSRLGSAEEISKLAQFFPLFSLRMNKNIQQFQLGEKLLSITKVRKNEPFTDFIYLLDTYCFFSLLKKLLFHLQ